MADEDDIQVEAVRGLPEKPPAGEIILWQGRPQTWALAREALSLYWILGYFALLAVWRVGVSSVELGFVGALPQAVPFVILGAATGAILLLVAWAQARAAVYTITTHRVAMRVGAALTVTLNLPFTRIAAANLDLRRSGTGTIALTTTGEAKLSYLVLWPHVRPWRMKTPEPALRCIPDAERVAQILAEAAETRVSQPELSVRPAEPQALPAE